MDFFDEIKKGETMATLTNCHKNHPDEVTTIILDWKDSKDKLVDKKGVEHDAVQFQIKPEGAKRKVWTTLFRKDAFLGDLNKNFKQ